MYLVQGLAITIDNIHSLDWVVPDVEGVTFRQQALEALSSDKAALFSSIEMGVSDNKIHLLTTKNHNEEATFWVDQFTDRMKQMSSDPDYWLGMTGGT